MNAKEIAEALDSHHYTYQNELDLQTGIAFVLTQMKVDFRREVRLTKKDRIDFLVDKVGIEVKTDGALAAVTRQLWRYAECPEIEALVLVTTRQAHRNMPDKLMDKPLFVIWLNVFH